MQYETTIDIEEANTDLQNCGCSCPCRKSSENGLFYKNHSTEYSRIKRNEPGRASKPIFSVIALEPESTVTDQRYVTDFKTHCRCTCTGVGCSCGCETGNCVCGCGSQTCTCTCTCPALFFGYLPLL